MKLDLDNDRILQRMRQQSKRLQSERLQRPVQIQEEDERRLAEVLTELAQEIVRVLPWWARLGLRASGADVEDLVAKALRWTEGIIVDIIEQRM